jgi:hypothetical protein
VGTLTSGLMVAAVLHPANWLACLQAWASFFCAWISTFSPAALLPVIRESLDLTTFDIGNAGIAALCGAIAGIVLSVQFCGFLEHLALFYTNL